MSHSLWGLALSYKIHSNFQLCLWCYCEYSSSGSFADTEKHSWERDGAQCYVSLQTNSSKMTWSSARSEQTTHALVQCKLFGKVAAASQSTKRLGTGVRWINHELMYSLSPGNSQSSYTSILKALLVESVCFFVFF